MARSLAAFLQRAMADIAPVLHAVVANALDGFVGTAPRDAQGIAERGDAEHAAAVRDEHAALEPGAGMEHTAIGRRRRYSLDPIALARLVGIPGCREHHAERAAAVPFRLGTIERAGERVVDEIEEIGLQAHEDRLRFRVAQP